MKVIEICAGGGGMALGFEWAGWSHLALVEFDPLRCQVLRRNRPEWPVICADVREWSWEGERPDLLCGGVPCQPNSRAGKRKLDQDPRDLWPHLPNLIERVKPRMICFENVPGVSDNPSVQALGEWLWARGWGWCWWRLDAVDFGVPQTRERWFFVGLEGAGLLWSPQPPKRTCVKPASIAEALKGDWGIASTLPNWLRKRLVGEGMMSGKNDNKGFQCDRLGQHGYQTQKNAQNAFMDRGPLSEMPTSKQTRSLDEPSFCLMTMGNFDDVRSGDEPSSTVRSSQRARAGKIIVSMGQKGSERTVDQPSPVVTGNRGKGDLRTRIIDGFEVWAMTERQLQKLQAFPDDWYGMTTAMIGDAVPPPLAEAVARELLKALK